MNNDVPSSVVEQGIPISPEAGIYLIPNNIAANRIELIHASADPIKELREGRGVIDLGPVALCVDCGEIGQTLLTMRGKGGRELPIDKSQTAITLDEKLYGYPDVEVDGEIISGRVITILAQGPSNHYHKNSEDMPLWKPMRKIFDAALDSTVANANYDSIREHARAMLLNSIEKNKQEPFQLADQFGDFTLQALIQLVFGDSEEIKPLAKAISEELTHTQTWGLWSALIKDNIPVAGPFLSRMLDRVTNLKGSHEKMLEAFLQIQSQSSQGTFMSLLLDQYHNEVITWHEMYGAALLMLVAGSDTTRKTMGLITKALIEKPELKDKLRFEKNREDRFKEGSEKQARIFKDRFVMETITGLIEEDLDEGVIEFVLRQVHEPIETSTGYIIQPKKYLMMLTRATQLRNGLVRKDAKNDEILPHLSRFSVGAHACPGRITAITTISAYLEELLDILDQGYELTAEGKIRLGNSSGLYTARGDIKWDYTEA